MKTNKSKKYVLKILERNPCGKDTLLVELAEWLEQTVDDDFLKEDSKKKSESDKDLKKYDEPF